MEESLKKDVLRELRAGGGRILLHDEVEDRPGVFSIVPIWERVEESDIMTPCQVFETAVDQGYKVSARTGFPGNCGSLRCYTQVNYGRVAIVRRSLFAAEVRDR